MRLFGWHWLAASSLLIGALAAHAEKRPQYGGTLHVAMHAAPLSLDPADRSVPDSFGRRSLTALIFDTLVTLDSSGRPRPALGESWQTAGNQRWQFRLRHGEILPKLSDPLLPLREKVSPKATDEGSGAAAAFARDPSPLPLSSKGRGGNYISPAPFSAARIWATPFLA